MAPGRKLVLLSLMRVLLLVMSFVLAVALLSIVVSLRDVYLGPPYSDDLLKMFCYVAFLMLWYGWKGLVLALPAVLFFTDLRAWRFWALQALGTALGPVYFCLLLASSSHWHFMFGISEFLIPMPISGLSALIYLLLLRRSQRLRQA
jgi:hypothetical protein